VIEAAGLTVAGGKELALDLMSSLAGHTQHQFTFIVPHLEDYKGISGGNIRTIVCKQGAGLLQRTRLLNHQVPRICREEAADALLCLGNFVPWKPVCPTAVLLQNAWVVYDDPVADSRRTPREHLVTAYGRYAYRHLGRDINIITQTPVMKNHLCQRYSIDPKRVTIIPNTLSLAKLGADRNPAASVGSGAATPFTFLCLAHCYAHKNIGILLDAAQRLPNFTSKPAKCVITVAAEQHPSARRLLKRLDEGELAGKIENIGPVPSRMLPQVYQKADALIFPTLLESFSRTYLEALYFGLPILTSDRDFARNLCQNAAIYFDPLDAESVARAMARVMEEADLRQRLVESGRRILAQSPSWDEIAARFVEVLERTAGGEEVVGRRQFAVSGRRLAEAGTETVQELNRDHPMRPSAAVRTLFNHKARGWRNKYGSRGKLNSRVEQFAATLAELCPPPARILDLGCGTGEIAAAIDLMGYQVTACDFAEEMMAVARGNHSETSVDWVCLEPEWKRLPFAAGSFDGVVASSVFEYLDDVNHVAVELSRVLRAEGVLLLTVPNPRNLVRKLEARAQAIILNHRISRLLPRIERLDSFATYLRLSRNRFDAEGWKSVLNTAGFAPFDSPGFSPELIMRKAGAPLVLLAVKRMAAGESEQFVAEAALCRASGG
jgi:glycosyltransferase involved in cell wall biosynthesis/SAM-dependent methyltransferase